MRTNGFIAAALGILSACSSVQTGSDALSLHLSPKQAQACRDETRTEMAKLGLGETTIESVYYQVLRRTRAGGHSIAGFEAWVTPKDSEKVMIVELSPSCEVRRVWAKDRNKDAFES